MSAKTFIILLIVLVSMLVFGALKSFAEETTQSANDNRAVVALQKQPSNKTQKQEAKQNKWCIIVQINGKVKDTADTDAK